MHAFVKFSAKEVITSTTTSMEKKTIDTERVMKHLRKCNKNGWKSEM